MPERVVEPYEAAIDERVVLADLGCKGSKPAPRGSNVDCEPTVVVAQSRPSTTAGIEKLGAAIVVSEAVTSG